MRGWLTSDELGTGVFVDLGHIDDCPSLLGVAQSAEAFLHIAACRAQRGDHSRLGVTSKTLFQQPAEGENQDYASKTEKLTGSEIKLLYFYLWCVCMWETMDFFS